MGVEHFIVCNDCGSYADLHKAYAFALLYRSDGYSEYLANNQGDGPRSSLNNYWSQKGFNFLQKHWGHKVEMTSDCVDNYFDMLQNKNLEMEDWR